jgi:cell division protein ZapD
MEAELANSIDTHSLRAKVINFEHPLNERYRFFLRLEYLFKLLEHHMAWEAPENSHTALSALLDIINVASRTDSALLDIINVASRTDIKAESVKELDRIAGVLTPLMDKPGIELTRLDQILNSVKQTSAQLREITGPIDKTLKEEELLKALQLRNNIPGGMCDFDLPSYRYWLQQTPERRLQDLHKWVEPFNPLRNAIDIALELVRASTSFERHTAEGGIYKQVLNPKIPCQLIIVSLPANTSYYAEVSGSKHRFSVRFLDTTQKHPSKTSQNVEFDLSCCKL